MGGTVRDYEVLDDRNLVVRGSGNKKYHMWLSRPSMGLRSAWGIGFSDRMNRICPGSTDLILTSGFDSESVPIYSIRQIDDNEYEHLLVRYGKKVPEQTKAPPAEDIEGAEVEELD